MAAQQLETISYPSSNQGSSSVISLTAFGKKLTKLPEELRDSFNVACFTEVLLDQIHLLTGPIAGREFRLEPYGFVFTREFIVGNGGQPAICINSYEQNTWLREAELATQQRATRKIHIAGNILSDKGGR